MTYGRATAALALAGSIAGLITFSEPSFAMTSVGCPDLPAYARAQGTLQMGEGACNMTTAEAMRIVRQERPDIYGPAAQAAPVPRKHRRHRTAY